MLTVRQCNRKILVRLLFTMRSEGADLEIGARQVPGVYQPRMFERDWRAVRNLAFAKNRASHAFKNL
jgi:hypothetical protein